MNARIEQANAQREKTLKVLYAKSVKRAKSPQEFTRFKAKQIVGFTPEDKRDDYWLIRLEAFKKFGFTPDALIDSYWAVRIEAHQRLNLEHKLKFDMNPNCRLVYYNSHRWDTDAKFDSDELIRVYGLKNKAKASKRKKGNVGAYTGS